MTLNINHVQKNKLINTVYGYLNGADITKVRAILNATCNETEADAKSLYKSILVYPKIEEELFKMLQVPESMQKNYRNKEHLFELLTHLHQDGYSHGHLAHFLTLIDKTKYHNYKGTKIAILSSFTLVNISAFFYIYPEYFRKAQQFILSVLPRILFDWIKKTFSILRNLPFIGIIYTSVTFFAFLYQTFYHGLSNLSQKLTAVFFRGAATGLSLTAYIMCFLTAGVATPLTGILFISGSAIDVIQSVVNYCMIRFKPIPKHESTSPTWEIVADHVRQKHQQQHAGKTVWVNLGAAILLTAVVAMWCFFPPSILLTLGCMAATVVVSGVKYLTLSHIEAQYTEKLQRSLQTAAKTLTPIEEKPLHTPLMTPQLTTVHEATTSTAVTQQKQDAVITPISASSRGTFFHQAASQNMSASNDDANPSLQLRT